MHSANKKTIARMSDIVIACELRAAYAEVECDLRHGIEPSKSLGAYVAALTAEQKRRAA